MSVNKQLNGIPGAKQVLRALREGRLERVILAGDVDEYMRNRITSACGEVPLEEGPGMAELGKKCGIDIGTAVVGIPKNTQN